MKSDNFVDAEPPAVSSPAPTLLELIVVSMPIGGIIGYAKPTLLVRAR
jgi:hypothetical protein